MSIKGIYGDESHLFSLEQWVNVYELSEGDRAIYYASMKVKDLGELKNEDYGLEPVTEHGEVMSVSEAKQCCQ